MDEKPTEAQRYASYALRLSQLARREASAIKRLNSAGEYQKASIRQKTLNALDAAVQLCEGQAALLRAEEQRNKE